MRQLAATLKLDVTLQARSRLYSVGIGVAVMLGLAGRVLFGGEDTGRVLVVFYLLGLGSTTYIFGASIVLLDRTQGTIRALRASPLTTPAYITSKVITLTAFALIESVVVFALGFWGVPVNPWPVILGIVVLGAMYSLIGLGQVARYDSVTAFLMPGALLVGGVLQLPFLYVLDLGSTAPLYLIPSQGPLLLMLGGFEELHGWQWTYAVAMSAIALWASAWWARRRFSRFVAFQDG